MSNNSCSDQHLLITRFLGILLMGTFVMNQIFMYHFNAFCANIRLFIMTSHRRTQPPFFSAPHRALIPHTPSLHQVLSNGADRNSTCMYSSGHATAQPHKNFHHRSWKCSWVPSPLSALPHSLMQFIMPMSTKVTFGREAKKAPVLVEPIHCQRLIFLQKGHKVVTSSPLLRRAKEQSILILVAQPQKSIQCFKAFVGMIQWFLCLPRHCSQQVQKPFDPKRSVSSFTVAIWIVSVLYPLQILWRKLL